MGRKDSPTKTVRFGGGSMSTRIKMDLAAKSIVMQKKYNLQFHPLAEKLYETLNQAYLDNQQLAYLTQIDDLTTNISNFPLHQVSVINIAIDEYQIIGGCFSPLFNINNLNRNNTLLIRYKSSISTEKKAKRKAERKRLNCNAHPDFKELVIDFIYMDFIRAISLLSLKRPGLMTESLRQISREYHSSIWQDMFDNRRNCFQQTNLASLIDKTKSAIDQQI